MEVPLYRIRDLWKDYGGRRVLTIPELDILPGDFFCLVGPSGAGKSTLLRLLHFLEPPSGGAVQFQGRSHTLPLPIPVRRQIGMVFQHPAMLAMSVWGNVAFGLRLRGLRDDERVRAALEQVELYPLKDASAHAISGGEAQRVALARVMVLRPQVLLLDEPTANLDPYNVSLVEGVIKNLHQNNHTTIVLVTHNVFQARRLAERVGLLLEGRIIEVSPVDKFFQSPSDPRAKAFVRGEMIY